MTMTLLRAGALSCALLATTCLTTPAMAQTGQTIPPETRSVDANGVDLVSGDYVLSLTEAAIGSGEGALALVRTGTPAAMTSNWQNMWLRQTVSGTARTVTVVLADRSEVFQKVGSGPFTPVQGGGATLTGAMGSNFVYTGADGTVITFGTQADDRGGTSAFCAHAHAAPNGCRALALSLVRPNGARLNFTWFIPANCVRPYPEADFRNCDFAWRLDKVSNNFGYEIDFDFAATGYSFSSPNATFFERTDATLSNLNVSGETPLAVHYVTPSAGVTEVTVPGPTSGGLTWRFTSGTGSFAIRRPGSASDDINVAYGSGGVTQVTRNGVATDYARVLSTVFEQPLVETHLATTTITDALDHDTVVVADLDVGVIRSVEDPLHRVTSYQYDGLGQLSRVIAPEGNYAAYLYDGRGNLYETRAVAKAGSGLSDIVTAADFPVSCTNVVTCNRPTATRDALGRQTDYTWDATHGGLLTATGPAPSGSGTRPQTRYSYGQVTAVTGQPVYQLTGVSACQAGSSPM